MRRPIFDDVARPADHGAEYGEGKFAYLNRSGRSEVASVRGKIEEWLDRYPHDHRNNLVRRLRAPEDVTHEGALFELLLHEMLVSGGATIEAIEPQLGHTERSPDFLVGLSTGERFYLEATISTGQSDADRRAQRRRDAAIAAIDTVRSDDFFLEAKFEGTPAQPVTLRRLRDEVTAWLGNQNYDELKAAWDAHPLGHDRPTWRSDLHGMRVELRPIPRTDRVARGRAIGVQTGSGWSRTPGAALRQAMEKKAGRYGALDLPFVIAVNGLDGSGDRYDVMAALLGVEVVRIRLGQGADAATTDRTWDGLWTHPERGARNVGVSAVIVFDGLGAWTPSKRGLTVFNPWAKHALTSMPIDTDRLRPEGDLFREEEGRTFGQLIGLSDDWPNAAGT